MNVEHYTYRVTWSEEDQEFVATCAEFPSLSWLAETQLDALRGLEQVLVDVLADMEKAGERVPEPISERKYSGKFNVRVPESLHRELVRAAAEQDVSLNRLVSDTLARSIC